jgi:hypothetical protein
MGQWAHFNGLEAKRLTAEARASGRFKCRQSKIGIRGDGTQLVRLYGIDKELQRHRIWERDGHCCVDCKRYLNPYVNLLWPNAMHRSHDPKPLSKGAGDEDWEMKARCPACHRKFDNRETQFGKGKEA